MSGLLRSVLSLRALREIALTLGAIAGVLCLASTGAAVAFDVKPVIFRSGSMSPDIETGALAFSRTVGADQLRVGDVVTVPLGTGDMVTHRIQAVSMSNGSANLVLQGDANPNPDDRVYVVESAPRVMFDVPRAGYVVSYATGPAGIFISGIVVTLVAVTLLRGRRPGGGDGPRHVATVAATAAVAVGVGAGVAGTTGTLAYYEDSVTAASGSFGAQAVADSAGCSVSGDSVAFEVPTVGGASGYLVTISKLGAGTVRTVGAGASGVGVVDALDLGPGFYSMTVAAQVDDQTGPAEHLGSFTIVQAGDVRNVGALDCTDPNLTLPAPEPTPVDAPADEPAPEPDEAPALQEPAPEQPQAERE